jgi:hypothetical protein
VLSIVWACGVAVAEFVTASQPKKLYSFVSVLCCLALLDGPESTQYGTGGKTWMIVPQA